MIAVAVVLAAVAWMYGRIVPGLVAEWLSSPDASYGAILAAVAAVLIWRRRRAIVDAIDPAAPATLPMGLLIGGAALFVVGQLGADLFLTRLSLFVVLTGAVWLLTGARAMRTMAAPLAFLAMAIPLPALLVNAITLPLQFIASRIAEATLTFAGVPVFRDGNVLALPSATLEVAQACSGLRSLVSLVAIGALLGWLTPGGVVRRASMVVLAVPIAIVMNGLRIAATGIACETIGPRAASGAWHEATGWLTFVASVVLLAVSQRVLERSGHRMECEPLDFAPGERNVLA